MGVRLKWVQFYEMKKLRGVNRLNINTANANKIILKNIFIKNKNC